MREEPRAFSPYASVAGSAFIFCVPKVKMNRLHAFAWRLKVKTHKALWRLDVKTAFNSNFYRDPLDGVIRALYRVESTKEAA